MLSTYPRRLTAEALTQRRGSSRTSSQSDRSKHRYSGTSEFLAHVQLDDDPRAPIQQSVGEEFRQHDDVVTILMFYHRRASPKHRYNMIEVEYGGRGHRTRLRNDLNDQLVCLEVPPSFVYKGAKGRGLAGQGGRAKGVLLPLGVGVLPPILVGVGFAEGERERGGPATSPCPNRTRGGGRRAATLGCPFLLSTKAH